MTISDAARLHLYEAARNTWDEQAAETLINVLPADRDQLATKADIEALRTATKADIDGLRAATKADLADLRADMYERFTDQTRTLMVAMMGMLFSAVALAFAAAHFA